MSHDGHDRRGTVNHAQPVTRALPEVASRWAPGDSALPTQSPLAEPASGDQIATRVLQLAPPVTGCLWLILTALGLATTRHGAQLNGIAQLGFLISTCLAIASGAYERPLARLRARHQRTELPYEVDWDGFDRARADWDPIQPE